LRTLRQVSRHRTSIAIAHRLSTIADADTIFVLEHGRLAESGSHAALLRRDGLYADMWNRQLAEREEALDEAAEEDCAESMRGHAFSGIRAAWQRLLS
jgi:ATP-binding cassette subfamily B protein